MQFTVVLTLLNTQSMEKLFKSQCTVLFDILQISKTLMGQFNPFFFIIMINGVLDNTRNKVIKNICLFVCLGLPPSTTRGSQVAGHIMLTPGLNTKIQSPAAQPTEHPVIHKFHFVSAIIVLYYRFCLL